MTQQNLFIPVICKNTKSFVTVAVIFFFSRHVVLFYQNLFAQLKSVQSTHSSQTIPRIELARNSLSKILYMPFHCNR